METRSQKSAAISRKPLTATSTTPCRGPSPPLPEQTTIVRFLDHADLRIQRYIRAKEKLIGAVNRAGRTTSLINEYRTRLIADVVTGKLDVRETAAALPEVDPLAEDDLDGTIHDGENSNLGELDAEESAEESTIEKEVTV
ncbi:MAG: hypothetical protein OXF39_07590 [Nitrospira sp.]|nr:hypothetical protein [Nitrospira sp.]